MNPGTILIIVVGVIGLVLYATYSLKKTVKEHFAVVDEEQLSDKALQAMKELNTSASSLDSLFKTPDLTMNGPSSGNLSDLFKTNLSATVPPNTAPSMTTGQPPKTALPVIAPPPAPIQSEKTISDEQGAELKRPQKSARVAPSNPKAKTLAPKIVYKTKKVYIKSKCPPQPDLSEYVKKDSIPCYGCNLK